MLDLSKIAKPEQAKAIRAILADTGRAVADRLADSCAILGLYGVEHVGIEDGTELAYINTGETYQDTLAHDGSDFLVTSWGGWYEDAELDHAEQTGMNRCGYCGEWSDASIRSTCCPSFILCQSCGHCGSCGR